MSTPPAWEPYPYSGGGAFSGERDSSPVENQPISSRHISSVRRPQEAQELNSYNQTRWEMPARTSADFQWRRHSDPAPSVPYPCPLPTPRLYNSSTFEPYQPPPMPNESAYPYPNASTPIYSSPWPYQASSSTESPAAYNPYYSYSSPATFFSTLESSSTFSPRSDSPATMYSPPTPPPASAPPRSPKKVMPYRAGVTPFAAKVYWILEHPEDYGDCFRWADEGDIILIATQHPQLLDQILPDLFLHSSIVSFLRQLHIYSFQRLFTSVVPPSSTNVDWRAYSNPFVRKNDPSQLQVLKPKPSKARALKKMEREGKGRREE